MYSLEISLRYSPFPISIQKKEYEDVLGILNEIKNLMNGINQNSSFIELHCEKMKDKVVVVLIKEIIAVQMYEKSAVAGGSKRPGFSLDGWIWSRVKISIRKIIQIYFLGMWVSLGKVIGSVVLGIAILISLGVVYGW